MAGNQFLLSFVLGGAAVLGIAALGFVYFLPDQAYRSIDGVHIKYIFLALCWCAIFLAAALLWVLYYLPSVPRAIYQLIRANIWVTLGSVGAAVVGLPRLASFQVSESERQPKLDLEWQEVTYGAGLTLGVALVAAVFLAKLYFDAVAWEKANGPLTPEHAPRQD